MRRFARAFPIRRQHAAPIGRRLPPIGDERAVCARTALPPASVYGDASCARSLRASFSGHYLPRDIATVFELLPPRFLDQGCGVVSKRVRNMSEVSVRRRAPTGGSTRRLLLRCGRVRFNG